MSLAARPHPIEKMVEWAAPATLSAAVGWASLRLGATYLVGLALLGAALLVGRSAFRLATRSEPMPDLGFEPADFERIDPEELLLQEWDSILELDDPLEIPASDSRVVRLFARPEPTPGELVDRIVDFLADGKRQSPVQSGSQAAIAADASAALHSALANIRASLR